MEVIVEKGFRENERDQLEPLVWDAFGAKLGWMYRNKEHQARELLRYAIDPKVTIIARDKSTNEILGYLQYQLHNTPRNTIADDVVRKHNTWRTLFLFVFEHQVKRDDFYIYQLSVSPKARGKGIGSILLAEAYKMASELHCKTVSLHVVFENDKAKKLYNREGFQDKESTKLFFGLPYFYDYALSGAHYLVKVL